MIIIDPTLDDISGLTHSYFITREEMIMVKSRGVDIEVCDFEFYKGYALTIDDNTGYFLCLKYGHLVNKGGIVPQDSIIIKIREAFYFLQKVPIYTFEAKSTRLDWLLKYKHSLSKIDILLTVSGILDKRISYVENRTDTAIAYAKHYVESSGKMVGKPPRILRELIYAG